MLKAFVERFLSLFKRFDDDKSASQTTNNPHFTRSQCKGSQQCDAKCYTAANRTRTPRQNQHHTIDEQLNHHSHHHASDTITFKSEFNQNSQLNGSLSGDQDNTCDYIDDAEDYDVELINRVHRYSRTTIAHRMMDRVNGSTTSPVTNEIPRLAKFIGILAVVLGVLIAFLAANYMLPTESSSSKKSEEIIVTPLAAKSPNVLPSRKDSTHSDENFTDSSDNISSSQSSEVNVPPIVINTSLKLAGNSLELTFSDTAGNPSEINLSKEPQNTHDADEYSKLLSKHVTSTFMPSLFRIYRRMSVKLKRAQLEIASLGLRLSKLNQETSDLREQIKQQQQVQLVKKDCCDLEKVKEMIRAAISVYDNDKTNVPDFALESAGASIISTRCSETFDPYGIKYKILGMTIWATSNSPRTVIQPNSAPGECWAFKSNRGYLVIRLSKEIIPTAFTYEHISKDISPEGNIDSAPFEFQVRGLTGEEDIEGVVLGNYRFEDNGETLQTFPVQNKEERSFQLVELIVISNHGHTEYTCLYRFRVHGKKVLL